MLKKQYANKRPLGLIVLGLISFLAAECWPKVKLGQVEIGSNIAQLHSSST